MTYHYRFAPLAALLLVTACTTIPDGPSVLVLPGSSKNFDQFRMDDADCRQFASYQIGGTTPNQAGIDSGVRSAAIGTVLGAAVGAAVGGRDSAAIGAGTGLLMGSTAGAGSAQASGYQLQRRYDNSYLQCMYSKGNRVPASGRSMTESPSRYPPPAGYPVPPPGAIIR
ncbi:MAG TPA: hypothetical protein DIT28_16575 [Oxalobacteraceae bacterium]|jgi:hypothetical protein|nr:hypothetical protein [Oxalobacteraceae bacterium]HCN90764.1 hypothetical protein [Oxalobacteraceae bacterium]